MDILKNFNWIELLFILVLGILLFGPDRLPTIGAKLGSYARALQSLSGQFMAQWWEEAGVADVTREGTDVVATVREAVAEVRGAVRPIEEAAAAVAPEVRGAVRPIAEAATAVMPEVHVPAPAIRDNESLPRISSEETEGGLQEQALVERVAGLEKQMRELQTALARLEAERVVALSG
ncbi:MAG: twin-arginine translocase TatA/TatE family subunit [Anaerolineae bacterium]|nr:twin-arginine translocase TatA/TatE family subunit [Anaerolineae bacterium]